MIKIKGVIYKITNLVNSKVYVGQTSQKGGFDSRYYGNVIKNTQNKHLKSSFIKYGINNFKIDKEFDIAYNKEELNEKEIYWINYYNATNPKYGYNKKEGGECGSLNDECKEKMSKIKQATREYIVKNLLSELYDNGKNKFYRFNIEDYNENLYMKFPMELLTNDETDILNISIICYLFINTNKLEYSVFNLKDMIEKCKFDTNGTRIINKFKQSLLHLQYEGYINTETDIDSIKLNTIVRTKLNLISDSNKYVTVNILNINKLMQLETIEDMRKMLRLYLYLIHLSNSPYNIINGIDNIREKLNTNKETISKYLNILRNNGLIYYSDLGYIKTSLGNIRGGTCYATSIKNLEIIKNNCEYIKL